VSGSKTGSSILISINLVGFYL